MSVVQVMRGEARQDAGGDRGGVGAVGLNAGRFVAGGGWAGRGKGPVLVSLTTFN